MSINKFINIFNRFFVLICNAAIKAFVFACTIDTLLVDWLQKILPIQWLHELPQYVYIILITLVLTIVFAFARWNRDKKVLIKVKDHPYVISVEYGDILEQKNCQKVINFDECYTTTVGTGIADIKKDSICGQYLAKHPDLSIHIQELLSEQHIKKANTPSKYLSKDRYELGTIVVYNNNNNNNNGNYSDLLMAFVPLDKEGRGRFLSKKQYIQCLDKLWIELEKHQQSDICIPILGSGRTCFEGEDGASQQDFLNMMLWSYKLSSHKLKPQYKLRIICKTRHDFSIKNIDRIDKNAHKSKLLKILLDIIDFDIIF